MTGYYMTEVTSSHILKQYKKDPEFKKEFIQNWKDFFGEKIKLEDCYTRNTSACEKSIEKE